MIACIDGTHNGKRIPRINAFNETAAFEDYRKRIFLQFRFSGFLVLFTGRHYCYERNN
jgi:hypothetical protein